MDEVTHATMFIDGMRRVVVVAEDASPAIHQSAAETRGEYEGRRAESLRM
jgi:hypothetical protein